MFVELTEAFPPEARQRIEDRKAKIRAEMPLHELRCARALTQQESARTLNFGQPAVAKMERRADASVSNLRAFIEAMGGSLEVVASFPEGEIEITNFARTARDGRRRQGIWTNGGHADHAVALMHRASLVSLAEEA